MSKTEKKLTDVESVMTDKEETGKPTADKQEANTAGIAETVTLPPTENVPDEKMARTVRRKKKRSRRIKSQKSRRSLWTRKRKGRSYGAVL